MVTLRPYQVRAINGLREAARNGSRAPLLVMPTGGGKTMTASAIVAGSVKKGKRVLWTAHRRELVHQAAETLERTGLRVGHSGQGASELVQVASVQGLLARGEAPEADVVIYDEAHHLAASDWSRLADAYKNSMRIGLTATPERGDGRALGDVFDSLTVGASVKELIDLGALVPARILRPSRLLRSGTVARSPVEAYLEETPGTSAVVFCPHLKAAQEYLEEFAARGVVAGIVDYKTPAGERDAKLRAFRDGKLRVLLNAMVLTEGFDAPIASTCILARGCGHAGLYLQMVGRVLRPYPGKLEATILDLRGISHVHGAPDDERKYSLEGQAIALAQAKAEAQFCRVCNSVLVSGVCESCGVAQSELVTPEVVNEKLVPYAAKRKETPEQRIDTLAFYIRNAKAKGHNPKAASAKYKAVYGDWPPSSILVPAMLKAAGGM